jgi:hypothetical protein
VESSCELGNEHSGSIRCWESAACGLSSGTQPHKVCYSLLVSNGGCAVTCLVVSAWHRVYMSQH